MTSLVTNTNFGLVDDLFLHDDVLDVSASLDSLLLSTLLKGAVGLRRQAAGLTIGDGSARHFVSFVGERRSKLTGCDFVQMTIWTVLYL